MAITPLPAAPSRAAQSTFSSLADGLLSALPTFVTEANALQADVNAKQTTSAIAANAATASAIAAEASNQAAVAVASAAKWVSGTTYTQGQVAWSPINYYSYRRSTNGAGTTDPSLDSANWTLLLPPIPSSSLLFLSTNYGGF